MHRHMPIMHPYCCKTTFSEGPRPRFSSIDFECRGGTLNETESEVTTYLESYTECDDYLTSFWTSYHFLELGVVCGNDVLAEARQRANEFSFNDNFVECGGVGAGFETGNSDDHYQCFAEAMNAGEDSIAYYAFVPAAGSVHELRELADSMLSRDPLLLPPPASTPAPTPPGGSTPAPTPGSTTENTPGSTTPGSTPGGPTPGGNGSNNPGSTGDSTPDSTGSAGSRASLRMASSANISVSFAGAGAFLLLFLV
jgi:hypothetical protein